MSTLSRRLLFWTPRSLSIAFAAFLSLFALDVFSEPHGFWDTALALIMHLVPVFVVLAILALAWRWEWIGAVLYSFAGLLYVALTTSLMLAPAIKLNRILTIAGPAFLIALLFMANWLKRRELHTPEHQSGTSVPTGRRG
ncbi:MAG: hypothetical protein WBW33_27830 [Bryobacteraceae bacterium]